MSSRDGDGIGDLGSIETQQLCRNGGRSIRCCNRTGVPSSDPAPFGCVAEAKLYLVANDDAEQKILAGQSLHLGHRERWRHINTAMMRAAQSGIIVVVEIANRHFRQLKFSENHGVVSASIA